MYDAPTPGPAHLTMASRARWFQAWRYGGLGDDAGCGGNCQRDGSSRVNSTQRIATASVGFSAPPHSSLEVKRAFRLQDGERGRGVPESSISADFWEVDFEVLGATRGASIYSSVATLPGSHTTTLILSLRLFFSHAGLCAGAFSVQQAYII